MFDGALRVALLSPSPIPQQTTRLDQPVCVASRSTDRAARLPGLGSCPNAAHDGPRGTERGHSLGVGRLERDDLLAAIHAASFADVVHPLELTTAGADHDGCGEVELVVGATHAFAALGCALLRDCHEDTMGSEG